MDKSILLLIASGVVVAFLHMPTLVITIAIIATLVMMAVKVCWKIMQSFSQPSVSRRTQPVRNY